MQGVKNPKNYFICMKQINLKLVQSGGEKFD